MAASARPVLKALASGGPGALQRFLEGWSFQLRGAMLLTGSRTLRDLQHAPLNHVAGQ